MGGGWEGGNISRLGGSGIPNLVGWWPAGLVVSVLSCLWGILGRIPPQCNHSRVRAWGVS